MKKETILAIILGVSSGIIVAIIVLFSTKKDTKTKVIPVAPATNITPVASSSLTAQSFELMQPEDSSVTDQKTTVIKGKAAKESLVVVQSPVKYLAFKNDKDDFSIDFPLALGENIINIAVYPKDTAAPMEKELKVYYLEE